MKKLSLILLITIMIMVAACARSTIPTMTAVTIDESAGSNPIATIQTNFGNIKIELFKDKTPETVKNFIAIASEHKYDGVIFHRIIKDFMIQTGDFEKHNGTGGYSYKGPNTSIDNEIVPELSHIYGAVSMANRGPDTNGSQFFIVNNKDGASYLDGSYSIFGQVIEGMDTVEKISNVPVNGSSPI